MESVTKMNQVRMRAAALSLGFAILILIVKFSSYFRTHSMAVLSDAVESIVNVVAAALALIVIRQAVAPADREHPYGHGKLEYFSAAFEGGLVFFAALAIFIEAFRALVSGRAVHDLDFGIGLMAVAGALNLGVGLYVLKIGRTHHSDALRASGQHILSDVVTTVGAIFGLILVKITGISWIDPIVAMLAAVQLLYSGFRVVRENLGALMDEQEPKTLELLTKAITKTRMPGIIDVHHLRIMRNGRFHHVDAHLVLPEFWDVKKSHEYSQQFESAIVNAYPFDGEIAFHIDPCERKHCRNCDCPQCPIRVEEFVKLKEMSVEHVTRENGNR